MVIRKEPRPQVKPALSISRHRQDSKEEESHTPYLPPPRSWRKSESKMRQAAVLQQVIDGECSYSAIFRADVCLVP